MRDLEECKAEIFRRSNERIKVRKRIRRRAAVCCASLCFLIVAGAGLQKLRPVDQVFNTKKDGAVGSAAREYASVRSTTDGNSYKLHYRTSDKEEAKGSYDVIAELFGGEFTGKDDAEEDTAKDYKLGECEETEEQDRVTAGTDEKETATGDVKYQMTGNGMYGSEEQTIIYEFVFRLDDGKVSEFRLSGNELTDKTSDRKIILTEEQLQTLKTRFGLSGEEGDV